MSGLEDLARHPWCGPDVPAGETPDRCADWRVRPTPAYRTSEFVCEGSRLVEGGARVLCTHDCHGLPDRPSSAARGGF